MPAEPKPIAVFLGPSLDRATAEQTLDADYYPPVKLGEVYRILSWGVKTIVIIDGVFHSTPSVWQRELLAAMYEGIAVIGASSMGALRAAELHVFGMVGVGQVFEWYRDGVLREDDAVALHHATEELDYRAMSEPLVNIMASLNAARVAEVVDEGQHAALLAHCKALPYPERTFPELLTFAGELDVELAQRLERFLARGRVDIKRQDALEALKLAATVARPEPFEWVPSAWEPFRVLHSAVNTDKGWVLPAGVLEFMRRTDGDAAEQVRLRARRRFFVRKWLESGEHDLPDGVDTWRNDHDGEDMEDWQRSNGLAPTRFKVLAAHKAACDWAVGNVDALVPDTPENLDAESRFILSWADGNGVSTASASSGSPELAHWVVERGPRFFGSPWEDEPEIWELLQIEGAVALLARAFFAEVQS